MLWRAEDRGAKQLVLCGSYALSRDTCLCVTHPKYGKSTISRFKLVVDCEVTLGVGHGCQHVDSGARYRTERLQVGLDLKMLVLLLELVDGINKGPLAQRREALSS